MSSPHTSPNPFATSAMAQGYATARPSVHPQILRLAMETKVERVLDIGCGAGISTAALAPYAGHAIGLEPAVPMLAWHRTVAPQADFVGGQAERLPFPDQSFELLTAAGSLNYARDLGSFFLEAKRVLKSEGQILVYDFSPGRAPFLESWYSEFHRRYPPPASGAAYLDPQILKGIHPAFSVPKSQAIAVELPLTADFFLNYMLTETNVAAAVARHTPLQQIRTWCEETLLPLWGSPTENISFRGYYAFLSPR
ncbi:methyltransferase domain-containing protein [Oscillatoria amoena NRMC-F 0135]|nr:methyltransferase domain-containing protein [Oscillatoria amoena NRMC-F 0135]